MSQNVLETHSLSKSFGKLKAVNALNISIPKGSVFGLLGPNGSGKTTTLGMLLGVVNPTSGSFSWFDKGADYHIRKQIGAILETPCFYHYLSAAQNLTVVAKIKEIELQRIDVVLDRVGLLSRKDDPFRTFSLGMKQRLAIGSALLSDPDVLVLDEPTNGLDPNGIAEIRELILSLANEGRTIILASHMLDEVQKVCTDFAVLNKGNKVFQGKVSDINENQSVIEVNAPHQEALIKELDNIEGVLSYRKEGEIIALKVTSHVTAIKINEALSAKGVMLDHLVQRKVSLEQRFMEILKQNNA